MRGTREIVIDAPLGVILDVLADVEALPSWSGLHQKAHVVDTYADGRPHHVRVIVKVMGIVDKEILEYHWGPDWMIWDAAQTSQSRAQHAEYTLQRERGATRVRFDITFEPAGLLGGLVIKRAKKTILNAATEGLRRRVTG